MSLYLPLGPWGWTSVNIIGRLYTYYTTRANGLVATSSPWGQDMCEYEWYDLTQSCTLQEVMVCNLPEVASAHSRNLNQSNINKA